MAPRRPDSVERRLVVPSLLAVAGVLAIVSGLLKWASLSFPRSASGTDTELIGNDTIALIIGFFLLVRAYMTWRGSEAEARRWGGWAIVSGGILLGYAIYDLATLRSRVLDSLISNTASSAGLPVAEVRAIVERQVAEGIVRFAVRPGLYLAIVAGSLAIVAGVLSLTTSFTWAGDRPEPAVEAPEPASENRRTGLTGIEPDSLAAHEESGSTPQPTDQEPGSE